MVFYERIFFAEKTYDFYLLFYPSYALPLIEIRDHGNEAIKTKGFCTGLVMRRLESAGYYVAHESKECIDYAKYLLGLWINYRQIEELITRSNRIEYLHNLLPLFKYYGIAVSPKDDVEIFVSIFLSQNTDYHVNTVRWVRKILDNFDIRREGGRLSEELIMEKIGRSYQLLKLPETLKCYISIREDVLRGSHKLLFKCPYVGPKIYFAYRLHVLLDLTVAPIDMNLSKFISKHASDLASYKKPYKHYCMIYDCENCTINNSCLENILRKEYKSALGWIQTTIYVYNDLKDHKRVINTIRSIDDHY